MHFKKLCGFLSMLYLLEFGYIPGKKVGFVCKDPALSHPYTGDTITLTILLIGSLIVPLLVILTVEGLSNGTTKNVWFYYKECVIGSCFVLLITEIIKVIVGEHRPHFFDVCMPDTNNNCTPGTYVENYTCKNEKYGRYFLVDTSRSFPSGHSSVSIFIALYCAYLVQSKLPTVRTGRLMKPFLVSVCLTWGLVCSFTRIVDRRHHWWDVLAGITLGACGAVYTVKILHRNLHKSENFPRISTSTTTLVDVKNKEATSVII